MIRRHINLDDIFDVGRQHSNEGGEWSPSPLGCITCGGYADRGSWCRWHHPDGKVPESNPFTNSDFILTADEFQAAVDRMLRIIRNTHG